MSRVLHEIEKGLRISKANSDTEFIDFLFGDGAPAGTSGETDEAPIGSFYSDRVNGDFYKKEANTSSASDWIEVGNVNLNELSWRNEKVRAATVDSLTAGSVDPTSFSDNESGLDGNDFSVGEYLLGDVDGVPALFEVTAVTLATDITIAAASQAIADNDTFVVQSYLPDSPASQEQQAIVHIPSAGSPVIKISDVNWDFADGINLPAGYAAGSGDITSSDTVNSAIEKVDGNNDAQDSALGLSQGDVDFGAFSGDSLADSQSGKQLFQRIEDLLEQMRGVEATGITTEATVDEVNVDNVKACKWLVQVFEEATPGNVQAFEIFALHDGTDSADAANVDDTLYAKLKQGANFNLDILVDLNGTGAAQTMRLRAASSTAGVTVTARRVEVRKSVL